MSTLPTTSPVKSAIQTVKTVSDRWTAFWFEPADPLPLSVIRFLTGSMLAYSLYVWGMDLSAFFAADGLQPASVIQSLQQGEAIFSLLFSVPDAWLPTVHWTCFGIAVLFSLGVLTRITSVLAFVITVSYSNRVPVANFGLDQILAILCLYLAVGPSGTSLSVDSWLKKRWNQRKGLAYVTEKRPTARTALRLIQVHLCVVYFWAGFAKLKGDSWWTGEAMWQVIANGEYQTMDLTWMAWVPWLPYLLAHVIVAWEVSFCFLVWNTRLRPFVLAIGTGMHLGIGAFLGMWTFGLIMTYAYFSFADAERLRAFGRRCMSIFDTRKLHPVGEQVKAVAPIQQLSASSASLTFTADGRDPSDAHPAVVTVGSESEPHEDISQTSNDDAVFEDALKNEDTLIGHDAVDTSATTTEAMARPDVAANSNGSMSDAVTETALTNGTYVTDDDEVIAGEPEPLVTMVSDKQPNNLLAEQSTSEDADDSADETITAKATENEPVYFDSPENHYSMPGDEMSDSSDSTNELKSMSRMERLKPKSANSLTGGPAPSVDSRVEDSVLAPETTVLLVAAHAPERNTFRTYLRRHDIPCRAAISAENAVSVILEMKPAAVLISGSCMNPEEIITLIDDINDMVDAPVLALLTESQIKLLSNDPLSAHVLQYPASLRQIREELNVILFHEGNAKPRCSLRAALLSE